MSSSNFAAAKIQTWWKHNTAIFKLKEVKNYVETTLTPNDGLQSISDCCESIAQTCRGDGNGLLAGSLIDMYLSEMLKVKLDLYEEYHEGECDMKICGVPLSLKKITGKSTIALDWSKNGEQSSQKKLHFTDNIVILNLKTEKWWKKSPTGVKNEKIRYDSEIKAGFYFVDSKYCKKFINLSSNNKTDTLINSSNLYMMLNRSLMQNLFIAIPPPQNDVKFDILRAFHKK